MNNIKFILNLLLFLAIAACNSSKVEIRLGGFNVGKTSVIFSNVQINEGDTALVNFSLSSPAQADMNIEWRITGNSPSDDFAVVTGAVQVLAGNNTGSFTLSSLHNIIYDLDRDYALTLKITNTGNELTKTIRVKDNEPVPVVQFSSASQNIIESVISPVVGYSITPASKFPVTVNYLVTGTAAGAGEDHFMSNGSFTIPELATSGHLSVSLNNDGLTESNETIIMTLNSIVGIGILGSVKNHTITIIDDESVNLVIEDVAVNEGGTATFTVSLSNISAVPVTFDWMTVDGTANSVSHYFSDSGTSLTITPPATSATITVNLKDNNNVCESTKTFSVEISNVVNALIADNVGLGTIIDPDLPTVSFSLASSSVTEGSVAGVTAALSAACSTHDVTFSALSVPGAATSSGTAPDFIELLSTTFTILQNTTSVNVGLNTIQDNYFENNESLSLLLSTPMGATLGAQTTHTLTINNDDPKPTLSVADVTVTEGSGAGSTTGVMTISLSAISGVITTVDYTTSNGTASTGDSDYTSTTGTATIAAGNLTATVSVPISRDIKDEWNETINFTLSGGNGNYEATGSDLVGVLTIQNDDVPPTIALSSVVVNEGADLTFVATLSAVSGKDISFDFNTSDVSATGGADYPNVSQTYTINAGSTTRSVVINSTADAVNCELSETFSSSISNFVNVTAGSPTTVTGTINDFPYYSIDNQAITEGGSATFTVTSSVACPMDVIVNYVTIPNSALPGLDYTHESGAVTIPMNQTTVTFDVETIDDSIVELPESLLINIRPTIGYSTIPAGILTIEDNEGGTGVAKIRMGTENVCAISNLHELKCWGVTGDGRGFMPDTAIGNEANEMGVNLVSVNLGAGLTPVKVLTSNSGTTYGGFSCALLNNNTLKCWGDGSDGKLGQGDTKDRGRSPHDMGDNLAPIDLGTGRHATDFCLGSNHVCTLLDNGDVKCFGDGSNNKLGTGSFLDVGESPGEMGNALLKVNLGAGVTATKIACGQEHNCALLNDGSLKCWGLGSGGRLGNGSSSSITGATVIPAVNLGTGVSVVDVALGTSYACAILDHGGVNKIKCWGSNNSYGRLGYGNGDSLGDSPTEIGDNLPFIDFSIPEEPTALSLSLANSCAQFSNGHWKCWGDGALVGIAGTWGNDSSHDPDGAGPLTELAALPFANFGAGNVLKIFPSESSCALIDDAGTNKIFCWGENSYGESGAENASPIVFASRVQINLGLPILDFNGGGPVSQHTHACAIVSNGGTPEVRCWGNNKSGQLGIGKGIIGDEPGEISALVAIDPGTDGVDALEPIDVAMGETHNCVLMKNGSVKCMGDGAVGSLGMGSLTSYGKKPNETLANQAVVNLGKPAISLTTIEDTTCALLNDFTVKCWGNRTFLGMGVTGSTANPVTVNLGANRKALRIQGGRARMCYLLDSGATKCFGSHTNTIGQLGQNLSTGTWGDTVSESGDNFGSINFGVDGSLNAYSVLSLGDQSSGNHSCVILNDGNIKCWGLNSEGQLGVNNTTNYGTTALSIANLTPVNLGDNVVKVTSAGNHTCAILLNESLKCWGGNNFGQLGYGDTTARGSASNPMSGVVNVDFGLGVSVVDVATKGVLSNYGSTCAVLDNGELKCWGYNGNGELGLGDVTNRGNSGASIPSLLPAIDLGW